MAFTGMGFTAEDPEQQPQGPPAPSRAPAFQSQPGTQADETEGGKSMLTPTGNAASALHEMLNHPAAIPEPLDPGTHIPIPAPRQSGPTITDLATARYAALIPRGFSAPRSGLGAGVNTQMRMQGLAPSSGFKGPQAPSLNGVSTGNISRQWGQSSPGAQVTAPASGLGTSAGHLKRAQGYAVTPPSPGQ